ncbi:helix-turn-helix domain-containing protein [Horticoccus sp. 23ND18S-11]|uniref:helix-turn-helix domain-containing protein n=1 Tax=Horticoccus sp. 23ND18S-11 TaxID=3391832 RepID=UPI0039C9A42E
MVTDKLKELQATRVKLATLEKSIADELNKELASLPAKYGFGSASEFLDAVGAATGASAPRRGRRPGAVKSAKKAGGKKRRTRAVITEDTRAQVKKLVDSGKTGAEIAATLKISLPSVQNIKKALGLVKKR